MANHEKKTMSSVICHYSFLLLWQIFRAMSVSSAWLFYKWGVLNDFLLKDYRSARGLSLTFWGQKLRSPVGIASDLDRSEALMDALINRGYGFGEFGTYTLDKDESVNRIVYCPKDEAVCMEMHGYHNRGLNELVPMLSDRRYLPQLTGVSLATTSSNETNNLKQGMVMTYPMEFEVMTQKVAPYCDYIVANLTFPGAELTERIYDETTILPVLQKIKQTAAIAAPISTPKVVVKLPSDLSDIEIPVVAKICEKAGVDAMIIGGPMNLTKRKMPLKKKMPAIPLNMMVGKPLKKQILSLVRRMYKETNKQIPIIACGGVFTGKDVFDMMAAGASLVQVRSVLYFQGPFAFKKMHRELYLLMKKKGFANVADIVGSAKDDVL